MKLTFTLLFNLLLAGSLLAQTFCLRLTEVSNDGSNLVVRVEMSGSAAFDLGSSNLQWSYDITKVSNPTLTSTSLGPPAYLVEVTEPNPGEASLNIELGFPEFGSMVNDSWTELANVSFTILNPADVGEMLWLYNGGTTQTVVYDDDETTQLFATDPLCLENLLPPLPVELLSFKATKVDQKAKLHWVTASEQNSLGFEVQKSLDGLSWEEIDWIPSQGFSHSRQTYETLDEYLAEGANYYRLKSVDEDLSFSLSEVEVLHFGRSKDLGDEISIFPNPAKDQISFGLPAGVQLEQVALYNQVGSRVLLRNGGLENYLDLSTLAGGVYFVEMQFASQVVRKKLILNK